MTANLPGFVNSALLTYAGDPNKRQLPDMSVYEDLGAAFRQIAMMQQQMQPAQGSPAFLGPGGGGGNAYAGRGGLTANFDHNWLEKAYQAGSADGATLGGGGKGGGGGGKKQQEDDSSSGGGEEDPEYDASKYGGFWGGTKDFFGWGKGNKFGFGR